MIDQLLDFVICQGTVLKDNNLSLKLSIIFYSFFTGYISQLCEVGPAITTKQYMPPVTKHEVKVTEY